MRHIMLTIYDGVRVALWVFVAAWALFAVYLIAIGPELSARAQAAVEEQTVRQNFDFCAKYGPPPATHQHVLCTMELRRLRDEETNLGSGLW
jgi:hypothetical protein